MIYFNFSLSNPFCKPTSNRQIFTKNGRITKNKFWEIELGRYPRYLFSIGFSLTFRESHSGFSFDFGLFGYWFMFQFYDSRHWNYLENVWEEEE